MYLAIAIVSFLAGIGSTILAGFVIIWSGKTYGGVLINMRNPTRALREPRPQRPPWFADVAFAGAHVATIAVGFLSGVGDPSPSVGHILGVNSFAQHLWATIFIVFGAAALFANIRRRLRLEATAILCISGGFALWALMVFADPQRASLQSGVAYLVIALIKAGWGMTLLWWTSSSLIFVHTSDITEEGESAGSVDQ